MTQCLSEKMIYLGTLSELDPVKTFECGQCFRWNADKNGVYTGVAGGRAVRVVTENGCVYISSNEEDFKNFWKDYFDLGLDY